MTEDASVFGAGRTEQQPGRLRSPLHSPPGRRGSREKFVGFRGSVAIYWQMMTADSQLLHDYAQGKSQDAFAELVRRHVNLVYSAAMRQVRSPQLAEEISQSVFADLASAAARLKPDTIVTAWLYQVTRRTAIDVIRRESRRQARERLAAEMAAMNTTADWSHIEPLLDEAMEALDETDRAAVLLRYFENKSLREVGESLGTSDDAAQKRVIRAVERLREFFSKRGIAIAASGLIVLISANAVQAAPVALAGTISTAALLTGTSIHGSTAAAATKVIAMTTLQKAVIGATVVILAGAGIYEARQNVQLQEQARTVQKQQAHLTAEIQRLQQEHDDAARRADTLSVENAQLKSNQTTAELLSLRSKVTQFEAEEKDPTISAAKDWLDKVNRLKQRLAESPEARIPELQFIKDEDWLNATRNRLITDVDYRRALASLRSAGENTFAGMLHDALQKYADANNKQFPSDLTQLQPYFDTPVDDAILQRWEILPVKNSGLGGNAQFTQKTTPDDFFDSRFTVGLNGYGSSSDFLSLEGKEVLGPVYQAFKDANDGKGPQNSAELMPFATTPEQVTLVKKMVERDTLTKSNGM